MTRRDRSETALKVLGSNTRILRERAGLTQEQAAARASMDVKRWQRLEAGEVNPTIKTLVRVTSALGTSLEAIIKGA